VPAIQTTQGPDQVKAGRRTRQRAIINASASKAGAGQFICDFPQRDWSNPASHIGHAQDQLQPIKDRRPAGPRVAMGGAGLLRQYITSQIKATTSTTGPMSKPWLRM
jgi:hypothetical protein